MLEKKQIKQTKGSCLCGKVQFTLKGKLDGIWFCHCIHCRKNYGMYGAFVGVPRKSISLKGEKNIKWYKTYPDVRRGFCKTCGSPILWDCKTTGNIYVLPGLIDGKFNMKKGQHIFTKDKGGYYKICDNLPQSKN